MWSCTVPLASVMSRIEPCRSGKYHEAPLPVVIRAKNWSGWSPSR
jgi:hypothetical protein